MSYCHEIGLEHDYEPTYTLARFTGEPSRHCTRCPAVTLDPLHDADAWREDEGFYGSCSCGLIVGPVPTESAACDLLDIPESHLGIA